MKLKNSMLFHVLVASLMLFSLTGCFHECEVPEAEVHVVQKVVYVKQEIPEVQEPPVGIEYNAKFLHLNGKDYYIMSLTDGEIIKSNWERYQMWSMTNYTILKNLADNNTTKEIK